MPIDLKNLKSAVTLSPQEAMDFFEKRMKDIYARGGAGAAAHTSFKIDDKGLKVSKASGGLLSRVGLDTQSFEKLASARAIKWAAGMEDRVFPYWASDERVDRHGDIVRQFWDFKNFEKNPLVLWGHEWGAPPIGASLAEAVEQRSEADYKGPALKVLAMFATGYEFAETIFNLTNGGFLKAGSVGFYSKVVTRIQDPAERPEGMPEWGVIYGTPELPNELIEWTIASVPANPGAHLANLEAMVAAKRLKVADVQVVRELARREIKRGHGDSAAWAERDAEIQATFRSVLPRLRAIKHGGLDEPVVLEDAPEGTAADEIATMLARIDSSVKTLGDRMDAMESSITDMRGIVESIDSRGEDEETRTEPEPQPDPNADNAKTAAAKASKTGADLKALWGAPTA